MKNVKDGHTRPVIWLDPGHDNERSNPSPVVPEYFEGQRMWDLAQMLVPRLEAYGMEVRVTKLRVNQGIDLVPRGEMSEGGDLFISLHSNAAATPDPDWVLVLHQVNNGGSVHETSRDIAEKLAAKLAEVMGVSHQVYAAASAADRDRNGYPDDYYGVLRGAQAVGTPGIIVEHGFHTNEKCARWLMDNKNLERIAEAEAAVLAQWFDMEQQNAVERWYRIRKNWEDEASQIGAYRILQNAQKACPAGYQVYDWEGNPVFGQREEYSQEQFLRQLQAAIGAAMDGIAGPETLSKTPSISAVKNSCHKAVLPVQKRLFTLGYTEVGIADGIAGPKFTKAVKAYQRANGCVQDGEITAGQRTWRKLLRLE